MYRKFLTRVCGEPRSTARYSPHDPLTSALVHSASIGRKARRIPPMSMADCALLIRPTGYCGVKRLTFTPSLWRGRRRRPSGLGVGMLGGGHHPLGGAGLDDLAVLHDETLVGQLAHDAEILA